MTPTQATAEETALCNRIAGAALDLRTAMNRIPEPAISPDCADAMDAALQALCAVEAATAALETLEDLTVQGALLARSSRSTVLMIRHALTLLFAELDAAA
jgi:hypothetical protein